MIGENSTKSFASVLSRLGTTRYIIPLVGLTLLFGCRTDPSIELLEAEARYLEDKVYALQDIVEQKESELEAIRRENDSLKNRSGIPDRPARSTLSNGAKPAPETRSAPESPMNFPQGLEPRIEMGKPGNVPELDSVAPPDELEPIEMLPPPADDLPKVEAEVPDLKVTQFELNPRLTGGYDVDGQPGDDGIMVVVEPRNSAGNYVPYAGPVSIVLLDPAYSGKEGYVGRWDFDTLDTAKHLKKTLIGKGIHLKVPWSKQPEHDNLLLHVRYTTQEGEVLDQKKDIKLDLHGNRSASWTPAAVPLPSPKPSSAEAETPASTANRSSWEPYR